MSEQLIKTPSVFGDNCNFLLERELGSGGMGGVYMGRDKMLDRPVAVKVLLKEYGSDVAFLEKFKKEAQAAARLVHPNIVQVYSYGIAEGMPYIAMELAAGGSLYSLMNANPGKTDIQRVLKICQQIAMALQCATDQGVIHGDVKPENILLDANGNAKLVDFGLAAMQKDTTEIWGTPYYISPEKVKKETIDFRADMYSLGGTLYHALTGVAPFEGTDAIAVVKKRFEGSPKKPSEIRPEITPAIDALVMTMLEFDREKRYPSFEALLEAFKDVLSTGLTQSVRRPTTKSSAGIPRPMIQRKRRIVIKSPASSTSFDEKLLDKSDSNTEEDNGEGDNLGAKVTLVVVGVIALIGAIVGGLIWFQASAAKERERLTQMEIVQKGQAAHDAIINNRKRTEEFENSCVKIDKEATEECERITATMTRLLPEFANDLKPILTTNAVAKVDSEKKLPDEVIDMQDLWKRAFECHAANARLLKLATDIYAECDKVSTLTATTLAEAEMLGAASGRTKELYEQMSTSKDNETLKKGANFIKSKGKSLLQRTDRRLRIQKAEKERAAKKAAHDAAEKEAREKAEQEKKALIERESAEIASKFDAIAAQGCFRQLDWDSAIRQLNAISSYFKTAEGKLAAENQIKKVERMKSVQDLLIAKLPGYVFQAKIKGKDTLQGCKVSKIDDREIVFIRTDKKTYKITWQKFYTDKYAGYLNELLNRFVVNGRDNSDLNLRAWADAMTGAAMTLRLVCSEVNGASARAEQLAKEVFAKYEDYHKVLKDSFPDISFDDVEVE